MKTPKYFIENSCINIKLNDFAVYSLSIKVKQSEDTDQYTLENVWKYVIGTICINILTFLINWRVNIDNNFISKVDYIKTQLNNSGVISQGFIEYVEFKEIDSQNIFDLVTSLISLSSFSTIFIGQTHNILRQGWVQLKNLKLLDNLNVWVRKLILENIFNVDEVFGMRPQAESML